MVVDAEPPKGIVTGGTQPTGETTQHCVTGEPRPGDARHNDPPNEMILPCFQQHSFCHHSTAHEVRRSGDMTEQFHLFRVFDFARTSRVYILSGSLRANGRLEPMLFRTVIRVRPTR